MKKKLFSILLSLAMVITMMPAMTLTAFASTNVDAWTELQSGINSATSAIEFALTNDLTAGAGDSAITVGDGKTVTIDLKGHTINRNLLEATANGFVIKVEGNLTIKDSASGGKITGGHSTNTNGGAGVYVTGSGELKMIGGSITGNTADTYAAGVYVDQNATFNMTGGEISGNSGGQGAGVYSKGTFTMSGNSLITGNTGTNGGGVGIFNGTFTMKDNSKITNNKGSSGSGGVAVTGTSSTFNMLGGSIEYNSGTNGGGVVIGNDVFIMTGGTISNNTASTNGGGVYAVNGITLGGTAKIKDNVKGGTITGGELSGGAANNVYLPNNKYITIAGGTDAPPTDMSIGVTTQTAPTDSTTPKQFTTNGTANDKQYFFSDSANYYVGFNSNNNSSYLELKIPASGNYAINVIPSNHGSVSASLYEASAGATITLTATPDSGYELSANSLKVTSAGGTEIPVSADAVNKYTFTMPNSAVTVKATFILTETPPTPGPTPGPEPTPTEEYTVPVESENTVQVEATIESGKAAVKEITKEIIEEVTKPTAGKEKSDAIVIDLSKAKQDVTAVELTSKTVENLAEAVASKDNAVEKVTIQMAEATVELDAKTLETVSKEAKGDTIRLVVDKTKEEQLKQKQQETLSNYNVNKTFEAYFESNGQRISSFNGGKVVVGIKFTPDAGKKVGNYKVYYVDDEGKMQKFASRYADGMLKFSTTHFSDYAIVYEGTKDVLLLNAKASGSKAIKLSWNGIDNATKYVIYGAKCGNEHKKLKTVKGKSYTVKKISEKKLIAHKAYKFYVVGYDAAGNKVKSRSIHFVTANTQGKYANVKTIKAKYDELLLSVGVTQKIGAKYKMYSGKKHIKKAHGVAMRYISNNSDVATVTKSGIVKAVGVGTATIYIQDIGGKYCKTKVTVE